MTFTSTPIGNNSAVLQGAGIFTGGGVVTITSNPVSGNVSSSVPAASTATAAR